MKHKFIITLATVVLTSLPFYGQKISVGLTSGLTVSTLSEPGNLYDNESLKTGFGGGLSLHYAINESFGVQSGIIYEQKGFRKKINLDLGSERYTGTYNYVTIPLLAEGSLAISGTTRLFGVTGPYAAFKTYAENALSLPGKEVPEDAGDESIKSEECGWIIGGGVQVPAGNHFIQAGFRYSLGLSEVTAASPDDRNKSVLFGVTLFF